MILASIYTTQLNQYACVYLDSFPASNFRNQLEFEINLKGFLNFLFDLIDSWLRKLALTWLNAEGKSANLELAWFYVIGEFIPN